MLKISSSINYTPVMGKRGDWMKPWTSACWDKKKKPKTCEHNLLNTTLSVYLRLPSSTFSIQSSLLIHFRPKIIVKLSSFSLFFIWCFYPAEGSLEQVGGVEERLTPPTETSLMTISCKYVILFYCNSVVLRTKQVTDVPWKPQHLFFLFKFWKIAAHVSTPSSYLKYTKKSTLKLQH